MAVILSRGIRHQLAHNEAEGEYGAFRDMLLSALEDPEVARALRDAVETDPLRRARRSPGPALRTTGQAADWKRKASGRVRG